MGLDPQTEITGRDGGFLFHGDNKRHNKSASNGCIVTTLSTRKQIHNSGDDVLTVSHAQDAAIPLPITLPFMLGFLRSLLGF
jgi:hypothetical protein